MALKQIKNKIKATERTSKVTKAMQAVSAVKMRKSQERALAGRPFAEAALRILEHVSRDYGAQSHPLFAEHAEGKHAVVVVTSDKGLAGSLNSSVLKEAERVVAASSKENVAVICFGRKSYEHFSRRGYEVPLHFLNVQDDVSLDDFEVVASHLISEFSAKRYHAVHVVYESFISTFAQEAVSERILPLKSASLQEIVAGITPSAGKWSGTAEERPHIPYTVEPSGEEVYAEIFPLLIKVMLYHALLESKASEHSSRMVAMKNATDKAEEVERTLTLAYNKERQSVITAEVSEITGGIEAMKAA